MMSTLSSVLSYVVFSVTLLSNLDEFNVLFYYIFDIFVLYW